MDDEADQRYRAGALDYNVAWIPLTFLGCSACTACTWARLSGILT
jgi:hypothetical protein